MNSYRRAFDFLIFSAPLINFSLIPNSNVPLAYLLCLLYVVMFIVSLRRLPLLSFGKEDVIYLLFLISASISFAINYQRFMDFDGLKQVINLLLTYLVFKVGLVLLFKSDRDPDKLLTRMYRIFTWYAFAGIVIFFAGLLMPSFLDWQVNLANNSGNFRLTNIGHSLSTARSFGFASEPSFWSFFLAMNVSLGMAARNRSKLLLVINLAALVLTFGRTGLLVLFIVLAMRFSKTSLANKIFLVVAGVVVLLVFNEALQVSNLKSIDSSFWERFDSIVFSTGLLVQYPFFGIGPGNFDVISEIEKLRYQDIFNLFLSILVCCGVIGFSLYMLTLYRIYRKILPSLNLPFFAILAGWLTMSAYNLPFVWVTLAALVYCSRVEKDRQISVAGTTQTE